MNQLLAASLERRHGAEDASFVACNNSNDYNGQLNLRIAAIFVMLVGSMAGAVLPVFARRDPDSPSKTKLPSWVFFVAKFFGSGVIIATSFIHLLAPAHEALSHPCLTGPIKGYPWVEGILLMTIIILFFVELMVIRYARFGQDDHDHPSPEPQVEASVITAEPKTLNGHNHNHGHDHLGHSHDHPSDGGSDVIEASHTTLLEDYSAQLTSVFILEFGVIFHSIFIGLTLAVAGEEFKTLFIVLAFHQTFEGLGLGSRLATIPWPNSKRHTPYLLAVAFGLSTPIAIAIGLGVRHSYPPEGRTTLIVNGIFDSISAGILVYTSLVELMAHEFMFSTSMRRAPIQTVLSAFGLLCLGALLMALLGKWA
ncbi:low-affinity Zn(2+) transporter zrt2 [Microsporum canis]|uniref:Membrane zinc transporter n=1 Tax=Arthroderma otae (strain ATCC MYA-4605 / CBS 113480) TaxID=554155 RepID=C5FG00_ARTOC|nr:membrane zinc transporter [Microsporum canis CBS 113480]EEQ29685.1 membrane zinc transporter [Microsporum canis CBS 113480]